MKNEESELRRFGFKLKIDIIKSEIMISLMISFIKLNKIDNINKVKLKKYNYIYISSCSQSINTLQYKNLFI